MALQKLGPRPTIAKTMKPYFPLMSPRLRRIGFSFPLITAAAVAFSAGGQELSTPPIPAGLQPYLKDHAAPNTTIRAGFIPRKAQLVWGEPLQVTFTVENLGASHFKFWFGGDYRGTGRHDRFKITVTDQDGKALPDPIKNVFDMGGIVQPVDLKPGQVFTNLLDLASFRVIDKPGPYTVSCTFALDERNSRNEATNPVVNTTFALAILERTPERVAGVLDELVMKARSTQERDLPDLLGLLAQFGKEEAVPRLAQLAATGPAKLRAAALGALALIPSDASLAVVLADLKDSEPAIRTAAAAALGTMKTPRAVDALLDSLSKEKSPVAEAVVLALGASKSDRAFPVITNLLEAGELELQRAAVKALVSFGGSNAVAALTERLHTNHLALRYEIVFALAERLRQPMQADWLLPVLMGREMNHEWHDSLRLLRMYAGERAVPTMLSCLDFEVAWSGRNWWILNDVRACRNAPPSDYAHDNNTDGTPEPWEKNLRTLQALKPLAGPIPEALVQPRFPRVAMLKTDPPIDFRPTFKEADRGGVEIKSGFLTLTQWRNGAQFPYRVSEAYRFVYDASARYRSLPGQPERCAQLKITPEQVQQLEALVRQFAVTLCGPSLSEQQVGNFCNLLVSQAGSCPFHGDWTSLLFAYKEAPPGPLQEQAKADFIDSVRLFSQNYHAGTAAFVEAARKVFSPEQLEAILR
jgi:hypothetical protein